MNISRLHLPATMGGKISKRNRASSSRLNTSTANMEKTHENHSKGTQTSVTTPKNMAAQKPSSSVSDKQDVGDAHPPKKSKRKHEIAPPCHFMRLPPEVRLQIYGYHFLNTLTSLEYKLGWRRQYSYRVLTMIPSEEESQIIKKGMTLIHITHTIRIEALPLCMELATELRQSMDERLRKLRPFCMPEKAVGIAQRMSEGLELHRDDVDKIYLALQLAESHMCHKGGGEKGSKKHKEKGGDRELFDTEELLG